MDQHVIAPRHADPAPRLNAAPVPVFVDLTGRRGRLVTLVGLLASLLMLAFVAAVLAAVLVRDPVPDGRLPQKAAIAQGQPVRPHA